MAGALLVAAFLSLAPQAPATPATPGLVRGQIVNARTLAPVADALVGLTEASRTVRSSSGGTFEFSGVPPGTYTLTISTIGYIFIRRPVTVVAGTTVNLTIPLAEGTGTYEESVKVTAEVAPESATTSVTLNSSALQDLRDVAADDPIRALQALPGAATGDDFRAEFSVRGSAFRHVGIVIDGTPTSLLFHTVGGTQDPGSIAMLNTDILARASLNVGTHPERHGDWLGATLDFDVREGSRDRVSFRGAVSGTNASFVTEGPIGRSRRGSWLVSIRKSYVDWLVRLIEPSIDATVGFVDSQAKVGYDLTPRQHVEALFLGGRAHYLKSAATGTNEIKDAHSESGLVTLGWRYARERLLVSQHLSFGIRDLSTTGNVGQEQADGRTTPWSWRADTSVVVTPQWQVEGGVRAEAATFGQTLRDFTTQTGGGLRVRREQRIEQARSTGGLWGQVVGHGSLGTLTGGARVAVDSATNATTISPWLIDERAFGRLRLLAAIGRAHQFPALEELGEAVEPLRPEQAWNVDVGVAQQLTPTTRWRAAFYRRVESGIMREVSEDQLVNGTRVVGSTFPLVASRLNGTAHGVELTIERHSEQGPSGWIGYTWAHLRDRDVVTGETFDGDFDQRHTLNVFVQQRLSYRMKATIKLRVGSNFPIVGYFTGAPEQLALGTDRNTVRLPMYSRLDLSGSRTFTYARSRLTVFLELVNLLNRRNLGPGHGSIRTNLTATGYAEQLLPFVPSAGLLVEF